MKTLTSEQREYLIELNEMFFHNWEVNFEWILSNNKYNLYQKKIIDLYKPFYLEYYIQTHREKKAITVNTSNINNNH